MLFTENYTMAQNLKNKPSVTHQTIRTHLGDIAVQIKEVKGTTPIILLHGVYFDHHLWDTQVAALAKLQTTITLDMPLHGQSQTGIPRKWTLNDCAEMLKEVLDALKITQVIAIGHSWGSMTILRAANKYPERFLSVGFCNMPIAAGTSARRWKFRMQHLLIGFRKFYTRQVAKAMFGKMSLKTNPDLLTYLRQTMNLMSARSIRMTDRSVIMRADSGQQMVQDLKVPALFLKGKEDYVISPNGVKIQEVLGGHVSPLEQPTRVLEFINKVIALKP